MRHWRLKHSATVMTCPPKVPTVLSSELPRQLAHRRRSRPTWSKGNHPSSAPIHSVRGDPGDLWALVASRSRRKISITEPNLTCGTSHEISTLQSNGPIVSSSSPKAHPFPVRIEIHVVVYIPRASRASHAYELTSASEGGDQAVSLPP